MLLLTSWAGGENARAQFESLTPLPLPPPTGGPGVSPGGFYATPGETPGPRANYMADEIALPEGASQHGKEGRNEYEGLERTKAEAKTLAEPWWNRHGPTTQGDGLTLEQLIQLALENSPLIQSAIIQPQILEANRDAESGRFDPTLFMDSIFNDTSDPVGNALITGSAPRLNDHVLDNRGGIRKRNTWGGQAEASQGMIFKDSNSDFFRPNHQADTKMAVRYTQPLMYGRGKEYNTSPIVIAELAANQNRHEAMLRIQEHAFSIVNAYWELFVARAYVQQISGGIERLEELRDELAGRTDIDSLRSQHFRSESAIARQRANLISAVAQIHTAEAKLRAAVAAPALLNRPDVPIVPLSKTTDWLVNRTREQELALALNSRAEIQAIQTRLSAERVRLQVAEHELRPTLNLVLESYVRGLNGDYNAGRSLGDQFSEGAPSYSAGLTYARPYRNTTAKAIVKVRRLELQKTLLDLDQQLLTIRAEVEGGIVQVEAAYATLEASVASTLATHEELQYLAARWNNAFVDTNTSLLLDQLLSAQLQLIQAENNWARAQADHMISIARLHLATGSLLISVE